MACPRFYFPGIDKPPSKSYNSYKCYNIEADMKGKANYLTLKEAAEQLGVHPNTLRNWERRGVIRLERLPGSRYRRVPVYEVRRMERELALSLSPAEDQEPTVVKGGVRIEWPTQDPEAIARGEALGRQIQKDLAALEPERTLEAGLPIIASGRWVRAGEVLILFPPPDDPESQALAEEMALEVQAELAKVEPQGTLEEAMREFRGDSW
jgi:excisionase family DNA binding protein